jgi:hypothetical protein
MDREEAQMWKRKAIWGILAAFVVLAGCTGEVRTGYRAYDPYYSDYHAWNSGETVYYNQWIGETHRPYRGYKRLNREDQRAYWNWRHNHH